MCPPLAVSSSPTRSPALLTQTVTLLWRFARQEARPLATPGLFPVLFDVHSLRKATERFQLCTSTLGLIPEQRAVRSTTFLTWRRSGYEPQIGPT